MGVVEMAGKKIVVFFSVSGNTETVAKEIAKQSGADIVRVEPVEPYTEPYKELTKKAKAEISRGHRPGIGDIDIGAYDIVFVGSPNWWSTVAPPVSTFLEGHDFSGKTVAPFITHGGGGKGHADKDIAGSCNASRITDTLAVSGGRTGNDAIAKWISDNGL